nr:MAG TPA: single-stranded DNA-binding protein [Caudoviricetes sp.]
MKIGIDNFVALEGRLTGELAKRADFYGVGECCCTRMRTKRNSGVEDYINVVLPADAVGCDKLIAAKGSDNTAAYCCGRLQTRKDWATGKVLVYVLAEWIDIVTNTRKYEDWNVVHIDAVLGKKPIYRMTPKNRRITDVTLKVPNVLKPDGFCYIPTIFWSVAAERVRDYKEGDTISITGRLQSREYVKMTEHGEKTRIAYELSVTSIDDTLGTCMTMGFWESSHQPRAYKESEEE